MERHEKTIKNERRSDLELYYLLPLPDIRPIFRLFLYGAALIRTCGNAGMAGYHPAITHLEVEGFRAGLYTGKW
jgi:hypothetical protein